MKVSTLFKYKLFNKRRHIIVGLLIFMFLVLIVQLFLQLNFCNIQETYSIFIKESLNITCSKHNEILFDFYMFMSTLNIEVILIEPSILFCLLPLEDKKLLHRRRFNIEKYYGSENIIHFGVIKNNTNRLNEFFTNHKLKNHNFQNVNSFTEVSNFNGSKDFKTHYFFKRSSILIHVVVFLPTANYFRTFKIQNPKTLKDEKMKNLLFSYDDAAYEKFSPAYTPTPWNKLIVIPENLTIFLHQLDSTKFIECNKLRSSNLTTEDIILKNNALKLSFENALHYLKFHLQPRLINFFLFSGTLLGWYRQCNLIPYTHDVDFSAWIADVESSDYWIDTFKKHKHLPLTLIMGLPEDAFELRFRSVGKSIDLFFVYDDKNETKVAGHRLNYYFWYKYPKFTLCSGDLLGYKVLVPCETEEILLTEYGEEWIMPIKIWGYDSSPKNQVHQNLYWSNKSQTKIKNLESRLKS